MLSHPWITRDFQAKIPRTVFEENIFRYEIDDKLRKVFFDLHPLVCTYSLLPHSSEKLQIRRIEEGIKDKRVRNEGEGRKG